MYDSFFHIFIFIFVFSPPSILNFSFVWIGEIWSVGCGCARRVEHEFAELSNQKVLGAACEGGVRYVYWHKRKSS